MTFKSQTFVRSRTTTACYAAALDEIVALDRRIFEVGELGGAYDNTTLFRDAHDDDNIVVHMREGRELVGYGFVKIVEVVVGGRPVRAFQPLAGLLPEHVGQGAAMRIGIQTCFRVLAVCGSPTYMVGFVVNPGLYRGLSGLLDNLYPSPAYAARAESLEPEVLRAAIERWAVQAAPGYEDAAHFVTKDAEVSRRRPFRPQSAEDAFFLAANPRYADGHYLAVCARMGWASMTRALLRELTRRRGAPAQREAYGDATAVTPRA